MARARRSPPLPHAARKSPAASTVVISLDGDNEEVREHYREGIAGVVEWCAEGGITVDVSDLFGPDRKVITTRAGGALHVEVQHKGRSLTFLLQARSLYLRGWRGRGKVFELDFEDQEENFTLDKNCKKLKTKVNYNHLIGGGAKNVPTGLLYLRNAFEILWRHAGGEKIDISKAVAIFAVHISEASRFPPILRFICNSFTDPGLSNLGINPSNCTYVTKYKKASGYVMQSVDLMKAGAQPLPIRINGLQGKTVDELSSEIGILHRDGYNEEGSNFEHEDRPTTPIYENTMSDIGPGVQRKRRGGPKGRLAWERRGGFGGQGVRGGRGPKGGGFGGSAASFHAAAGPVFAVQRYPTSFYGVGGGPNKDGVGRVGEGLKGLLDEPAATSIDVVEKVFRTADVHHCHGDKHVYCVSYEVAHRKMRISPTHRKMRIFPTHRKMQIFPTSPRPIPLFSLLAPYSSFSRKTHEQLSPLLLNDTAHNHSCLSISRILKSRYISRALRLIH